MAYAAPRASAGALRGLGLSFRAKRLATSWLEVGKLLRLVREDVLATTARQQGPTFSSNIPAEDLFFRLPQ